MKSKIKQKRIALHTILLALSNLINHSNFLHDLDNATQSLKMARGWLGKALGFIGEDNPYPPSDTAEEIPPTADTTEQELPDKFDISLDDIDARVRYINALRGEIKHVISELNGLQLENFEIAAVSDDAINQASVSFAIHQTWIHLHECSMNLGFQLETIREFQTAELN